MTGNNSDNSSGSDVSENKVRHIKRALQLVDSKCDSKEIMIRMPKQMLLILWMVLTRKIGQIFICLQI
jgi:hypothetical protein